MYQNSADINDVRFLEAIERAKSLTGHSTATVWDTAHVLDGHEGKVGSGTAPEMGDTHPNIIRAKTRRAYRKGLATDCVCGCRGEFDLTDKGRYLLAEVAAGRGPYGSYANDEPVECQVGQA